MTAGSRDSRTQPCTNHPCASGLLCVAMARISVWAMTPEDSDWGAANSDVTHLMPFQTIENTREWGDSRVAADDAELLAEQGQDEFAPHFDKVLDMLL